jgi:N-acetylmuramoyl-L-alanine amidase
MDLIKNITKSLVPSLWTAKGSRRPLIGICVGHSRKGDSGASSLTGASEWTYNQKVAEILRLELEKNNINSVVFTKYDGTGYAGAMTWLCAQLGLLKVDFAVELHFNSADTGAARGFEFLYWRTSKKGQAIASVFQQTFKKKFPENLSRGTKGLSKEDRGGLFVRLPSMPAVILEPFFGSNTREWEIFGSEYGQKLLGETYAEAIVESVRSLGL